MSKHAVAFLGGLVTFGLLIGSAWVGGWPAEIGVMVGSFWGIAFMGAMAISR